MTAFTLRDPNNIGVAVLGAGRMGRVHVRNLGDDPERQRRGGRRPEP